MLSTTKSSVCIVGLFCASLLLLAQAGRAQIITPISFTGGNANLVYDFGAGTYQGSSDNINAPVVGVDGNYAPAADNSGFTNALPADLVIGTADGNSYQLGPLSANSGVRLGSHGFSSTAPPLVLDTPQVYSSIGFLATGGDGGGTVNFTLNFAGGATQSGSFNVPDWVGGGATGNSSAQYVLAGQLPNGGNTGFLIRLYDFTMTITPNTALNSIDFSYAGSNEIAIFAVSGTPFAAAAPEPSTYALLLVGALLVGAIRARHRT